MRVVTRTLGTALRALRRNIMRSVLTSIGIIIGISAVIAVMEIGNGINALNEKAIASLGANSLQIMPGQAASGGISFGQGSVMTLTAEDCDAILRECSAIKVAAPQVRTNGQAIYGNRNWVPMQIVGTSPEYLDARQWPIDKGDSFTDQDVRNSSKVCVIGQTIARELFGEEDPIGKEIRLKNSNLKVLGILTRKGANMWGQDQDDFIMAPWTTIKYRVSGKTDATSSAGAAAASDPSTAVNSLSNLYPTDSVQLYPVPSPTQAADTPQPIRFASINSVIASAGSAREIPLAMKQVTAVLRERHRLRDDEADDFQIRDMTEMMQTANQSTKLVATLLLIAASISLIVGGVGIMNIMLVSVTERTREIGLRMAVGARGRDILRQFLVEAVLLCLAGGIIGIALGRGTSYLVHVFKNWPIAVSIPAIVASVLVALFVGVVFGFYPAWKASRLDPIEALRYE